MTKPYPYKLHPHHGLEAPFDRGDVHSLDEATVDRMTQEHKLTALQRAVAYHLYVRKTSFRGISEILGKSRQSVFQAAAAVAGKLGHSTVNVIDGDDSFNTTFVHCCVPPELHALIHDIVDEMIANPPELPLESHCTRLVVENVPLALRDDLRDKIGRTVANWKALQRNPVEDVGMYDRTLTMGQAKAEGEQ